MESLLSPSMKSIMRRELIPNLSRQDLLNFCQTHPEIYKICSNDEFWEEVAMRDFPELEFDKPENLTWHQYYIGLVKLGFITIWYDQGFYETPALLVTHKFLIDTFPDWGLGYTLSENTIGFISARNKEEIPPNTNTIILITGNTKDTLPDCRRRNLTDIFGIFKQAGFSFQGNLESKLRLTAKNSPNNEIKVKFSLCQLALVMEQLGLIGW